MTIEQITNRNSTRGSEIAWLDAAHHLLIESGVESVKIMALANQLALSRTSFYWHFNDREALLDALIKRWEKKNTGNLVARTQLYAESITEAILNLFDCWVDPGLFDARMDFAIRNWAHQSDKLKVILEKDDEERIRAIHAMFLECGKGGVHQRWLGLLGVAQKLCGILGILDPGRRKQVKDSQWMSWGALVRATCHQRAHNMWVNGWQRSLWSVLQGITHLP